MKFFRTCNYITAATSETKISFENIFETGIFKGIKFCRRGKSFKVLAMIIFLFILFDRLFLNFLIILFMFWLAFFNLCAGQL